MPRSRKDKTVNAWCILRTSGRSTLPLADLLVNDGFRAWTPTEALLVEKRGRKTASELTVAAMPSFVFAGAEHLWTLVDMTEDPRCKLPSFSVFKDRMTNGYPIIADDKLDPVRDSQFRFAIEQADGFEEGERVRATEGPCCGMTGTVIRSNKKATLVLFEKRVEIATFVLRPETVVEIACKMKPNRAFSVSADKAPPLERLAS